MARHLSSTVIRRFRSYLHYPTLIPASSASTCNGPRSFSSQPSNLRQTAPSFAFAFDIDGVLLRSASSIPGASESIAYLKKHNIPFMLLTNGGGKTEPQRVADINSKLSLSDQYKIETKQIIQSHTPLSELAIRHGNPSYKDKTVLVVGGDGDKCRQVAESYGFTNVVVPGDIFASYPDLWPFSSNFHSYYSSFARPLPKPVNPASKNAETEALKIDAIFVFNDPRDWGLDCQLLLDVLLSHKGIVGTHSPKNGDGSLPNHGYQSDGQPPVYFSNPDLLWASAHPLPRLGQGGFREALIGVWKALTKSACGKEVPLKYEILGKPHRATYEYAEKILVRQREETFGKDVDGLRKVYMIGDNPESDIAGANNYQSLVGAEWVSILTRTGVFRAREGEEPSIKPRIIVDDVREGVRWALRDSGCEGNLD